MFKVEGLPDGWAVKEVHIDPDQHYQYVGDDGFLYWEAKIKMEKTQPRRIVFDEILDHSTIGMTDHLINGVWCREVKETDIPLTNEEPKLSLSVCECKGLFEGNQTSVNKVKQFIKDK